MIVIAIYLALITGPFDKPIKLSRIPNGRVIQFLNKDIWKIKAFTKRCIGDRSAKICIKTKPHERIHRTSVRITMTWRF